MRRRGIDFAAGAVKNRALRKTVPALCLATLILVVSRFAHGQGLVVRPDQAGTVSGTVRNQQGKPAAGVRVSAMAKPDSADQGGGLALNSLTETDEMGHYRLENIPPGQYYIGAGRVDGLTYYPGTLDIAAGKVVAITAGVNLTGIDFAMADVSVRPSFSSGDIRLRVSLMPAYPVGMKVTMDSGGPLPLYSASGFPAIRLIHLSDGRRSEYALTVSNFGLSVPDSFDEYKVEIVNLPTGYAVKSMTYGATDLTVKPMTITRPSIPELDRLRLAQPQLWSQLGLLQANGPQPQTTVQDAQKATTALATLAAQSPLLVTLSAAVPAPGPGVRVIGRLRAFENRTIQVDATTGLISSDGTFEVRGVTPGRHLVVSASRFGGMTAFGASIVVGNQDIQNVQLTELAVLPDLSNPLPIADSPSEPAVIQPASLRGRIVSEETGEPLSGVVLIAGGSQSGYQTDKNGRFEIPGLLPGRYSLRASVLFYLSASEDIVLDDKDVEVELKVPRVH
jgi:hypothetical protein